MNSIDYPHPPGSKEAVADGCLCPVSDNHHGLGVGSMTAEGSHPCYWFNYDCKLHGDLTPTPDDELLIPDFTLREKNANAE